MNIIITIKSKIFYLFFIATLGVASCGKHIYTMKAKEIERYARNAKEPAPAAFVVYDNGDTVKGNTLVRRTNKLNGKKKWILDGKVISNDNIRSFQDKNGFRYTDYTRLINGKISLYMQQQIIPGSYISQGTTKTSFYILTGYTMHLSSYNQLLDSMKDCLAALEQVTKEFANTTWVKNRSVGINDYRALIRVINIYNNCK